MPPMTPLRQQYLRIKKQFPDTIVMFRLGDFYETFDDDAKTVASVCNIVLTGRDMGTGNRVPLAGVPYHAVETYIAKLIQAGHKVAIVEQQGDPDEGRSLMQREVVRVVTPGTIVEPGLLEEKRNNYLAAVVVDKERAGVCYVDITTGTFAATELAASDVRQELDRLHPAEVLLDVGNWKLEVGTAPPISNLRFPDFDSARQTLLSHFDVAALDGFGLAGLPLATRAAGAIIQYLQDNQKAALTQLTAFRTYSTQSFMTLDPATRRNLELVATLRAGAVKGSLLGVLDETRTAMGARLLREWLTQPLLDVAALNARLDQVDAFYRDTARRESLRNLLKGIGDLERLANRVVQGIATPRDLLAIRAGLEVVPKLQQAAREQGSGGAGENYELRITNYDIDACPDVVNLVTRAISPDAPATLANGGVIAPGYSAELDGIASASKNAKDWVANLERKERERTGVRSLKVGYNKVFGYYIEVTSANAAQVPAEYIRKQTLVNAERFITPDLKEYESLILNADERIVELQTTLFREVCAQIAGAASRVLATARAIAELDVVANLAEVAMRYRYVRPQLNEGDEIRITAGRHPVVELSLRDEPFVPNDVIFSASEMIHIITGPNMSGKSTFLRQVALIVLMAQIGSFVPAEAATIGLVDRIFTRIGAQDEIAAGQSTFMVEMVEAANILTHSTRRSLIILDEIGRGTSTYDGIAIARAIVEHIHNHPQLGAKTLFATHYHELIELDKYLPKVCNYNVAVLEQSGRVIFLHKIVRGGADRSYGIHVAQLAGIPKAVVHRAEEVLKELESRREVDGRGVRAGTQLPLFIEEDFLRRELKELDVLSLSPLEALNKLFELAEKARGTRSASPKDPNG
ncbi:MAG: DNA mismatch repair protein MutS [Chloroflexi bacterium]|nr:DNA mismatch repair protein MutS [Chloroflexota bacterium]